jgi:hypothetical protein
MASVHNYDFRVPLLVQRNGIAEVPCEGWGSGKDWIQVLASASGVMAVVLPLELKGGGHRHQELFGIELLDWLRWCAPEPLRWMPVMTASWQPLTAILRRKPNLLLVCPGTQFREITDSLEQGRQRLREDIAAAQRGDLPSCDEAALRRYATGTAVEAAQVTYHDLANDHYAAYRLWIGYLHTLEAVQSEGGLNEITQNAISKELARAKGSCIRSIAEIDNKKRTPSFQHFKLARSVMEIPAYPRTTGGAAIFRHHILRGLPDNSRVLLVDDEFDKGIAEVLLQVLFQERTFTSQNDEQALYSARPKGSSKLRFVCVKTARDARNWLRYWGDLPFSVEALDAMDMGLSYACRTNEECSSFRDWLFKLGSTLGKSDKWVRESLKEGTRDGGAAGALENENPFLETAKDLLCDVDELDGSPKQMATVIILDLRLEKGSVPELYDAGAFSSAELRREVKRSKRKPPIMMFTASRQAMNYANIMADSSNIDGWLCKEAPDSPEDAENSANALIYLISHLHEFVGKSGWWHAGLEWGRDEEEEYSQFFADPDAAESLKHISTEGTRLLELVRINEFVRGSGDHPTPLLGKLVPPVFEPSKHRTETRLVARRLIVGSLLMTSILKGDTLAWNPEEFLYRIRGRAHVERLRKKGKLHVSGVGNQYEFWFRSLAPDRILQLLLKQELSWLKSLDWEKLAPTNAGVIGKKIASALDSLQWTEEEFT